MGKERRQMMLFQQYRRELKMFEESKCKSSLSPKGQETSF